MRKLWLFLLVVAFVSLAPACNRSPTSPTDVPIITQFAADVLSVRVGVPLTLRWDVTPSTAQVRIDPLVGNVPNTGSVTLALTATTTFTLNARALSGASAQRVLTIIVTP